MYAAGEEEQVKGGMEGEGESEGEGEREGESRVLKRE